MTSRAFPRESLAAARRPTYTKTTCLRTHGRGYGKQATKPRDDSRIGALLAGAESPLGRGCAIVVVAGPRPHSSIYGGTFSAVPGRLLRHVLRCRRGAVPMAIRGFSAIRLVSGHRGDMQRAMCRAGGRAGLGTS